MRAQRAQSDVNAEPTEVTGGAAASAARSPRGRVRVRARCAFVTGITGQDGSYLAELLLSKGYVVYGLVRRSSLINTHRIDHLYGHPRMMLRYGDTTDLTSVQRVLAEIAGRRPRPRRIEVYNLAAQSHVKVSFDVPQYTAHCDAVGALHVLEAVRALGLEKVTRVYQASTSEMYGRVVETPQSETTPFYPRSPYGVAKLYAHWIVRNYRESYKMYACSGILFNHESPRRGETFVTRKITIAVGRILRGEQDVLELGNLSAKRDWGHARDYVHAMWLMLQQPYRRKAALAAGEDDEASEQHLPRDYVVASGECHTVREFCERAFELRGVQLRWEGEGVDEVGVCTATGRTLVRVNPKYFRPAEVSLLHGNSERARTDLGWRPQTSFQELVREMMDHDAPVDDAVPS